MPSNERSAEWLRGAVESHINTCNLITSITSATKSHPARQGLMAAGNELHNQLDRYRALLATAEAREAGEPDVCALAAAEELDMLAAHIQQYIGPDDARDDIKRICYNRAKNLRREAHEPREATQPTAASVIEACRVALVDIRNEVSAGCHPDAPVEELKDGIHFEPVLAVDAALSAIARWKEANGGK